MENQSRIEELLAEALKKYDQMLEKHDETNRRLTNVEGQLGKLDNLEEKLERLDGRLGTIQLKVELSNQRLGNLENQFQKLNLQTAENTRSIIRLRDELQRVLEHEKRISKLEVTAYK